MVNYKGDVLVGNKRSFVERIVPDINIPSPLELLGVQTQGDADLFKEAYGRWCELPGDDIRKVKVMREFNMII